MACLSPLATSRRSGPSRSGWRQRIAPFLLLVGLLGRTASAQQLVHGFVDERLAGGLTVPVAFATLPDGRILVAEKAGVVRVLRNGTLLPDAFLDLRTRVNDYWDRGLLGIAADPAFATNGYVYLFYVHEDDPFTYSGPKTSRLVRVTATGDTASMASEVVLLGGAGGASCLLLPEGADCIPADGPSHNGGAIRFSADGALWVATGDASSFTTVDPRALRTQRLDTLAGKLIRVGRDGRGLSGNPFFTGDADAVRSKVWSYGFRNPFRFTIRPSTGRPYVSDVGAGHFEEVNVARPGLNYGWPCYEGPAPQPGYQPLAECQALIGQGPAAVATAIAGYPHLTGSASITGGAFYTGTALPDIYQGAFFFGDFVRNTLSYVTVDDADMVASPIKGFATGVNGPVDVQATADGLMYLSVHSGELRRIRYTPDTGPTETIYLGDAPATWRVATNGAGPVEFDRSHGAANAGDGGTLTLAGTPYAKGLGVKAPSDIRFPLGGVCTAFRATVGVDAETAGAGTVTVEVWLDGVLVAVSGLITGATAPLSGELDVTGKTELRLVVTDAGDGSLGDHVDWADAQLDCTRPGGDLRAPVVTVVSPVAGAAAVPADATVSASFSEALDPGSVGPATVTLVEATTTAPVSARVAYDASSRRVSLIPASPLVSGIRYSATLAGGLSGLADPSGNTMTASFSWSFTVASAVVNQPPVPVILTPLRTTTFRAGDAIAFTGVATDTEDGPLPPSSLRWSVFVRHCPGGVCHTHPLTTAAGAAGTLTAPDHGADSFLMFTLAATDSRGVTSSTSIDVHPELASITLLSDPPGLQVIFGETRRLTPATFVAVVGSQMSVATASPQHSLSFASWSSGAARQHTIAVGSVDTTYTARFVPPPGVSYLSDLAWTSAVNGAGPVERNRSAGAAAAGDGGPLTIRGITFAKGLGVRAPADLRFHLNGACTTFSTSVGLDDEEQGAGTVMVEIWVDGVAVVRSGLINGLQDAVVGALDLTGADELRLVVTDGGDGPVSDHLDWADARVECAGPGAAAPPAPTALSALAAGQTAGLSWMPAPGARGYRIEAGSGVGAADYGVLDVRAASFAATVPSGTYWVRVRATNAWGVSAPTADAVLAVDGTVQPPASPSALTATVTGATVSLAWSAPASGGLPTGYVIDAGTSPGALAPVVTVAEPGLTVPGVPTATYYVRVRAVNAAGASAPSAAITVVVP